MVSNAEKGLAKACEKQVAKSSITVQHPSSCPTKAGDITISSSNLKTPADIDTFADILDEALQEVNSDYEAKRYKGIFLDRLGKSLWHAHTSSTTVTRKREIKRTAQKSPPEQQPGAIEDMLKMNH